MSAKPYLTTLALILVFISGTMAQTTPAIKGLILDSISRKPVSYVTLTLKNSKGIALKSTYTKNNGSFVFDKLAPGNYQLVVTAVAYISKVISLPVDSLHSAELKYILLISDNTRLNEVIIKGGKPVITQELDRLIYDVHADPENKGLNMLDVMQKVPLLSVDADDNLKLKGNTDFKIYINGKPSAAMSGSPAEALRMMKSINVKRIEVITTPSAKYDSEGAAGIINIVTNNTIEGYNVIFEAFRTSRLGVLGLGSAFAAKQGKFGVNGYAGSYIRTDAPATNFVNMRTVTIPYQSVVNSGYSNFPKGDLIPANADMSYEIDSLNLLSSSVVLSLNSYDQHDTQSFNIFNQSGALVNDYDFNTASHPSVGRIDASLNYQLGFKNKKDRFLTTSYQYSTTINNFDSYNEAIGRLNYADNQTNQHNNAGLTEHTIQIDYVNPGKELTTELGIKAILRDNYSSYITEQYLASGTVKNSSDFNNDQDIYSIYNGYQVKLKRWGFYGGLRLERTTIAADFNGMASALIHNYNNLIPSVIIQRKFTNASSLNFGFTQRIQRPGILQLNPFENKTNPVFYTAGNPNLVPVVNNNFDVNYGLIKKGTLNLGLNYSFANNTIQNVVLTGNDGISRSTFANIGKNDVLGINLNLNYPLSPKLRINFNSRGQYLWLTGIVGSQGYNNEGFSFTTSTNFSYVIPKDWRLRLLVTSTKLTVMWPQY